MALGSITLGKKNHDDNKFKLFIIMAPKAHTMKKIYDIEEPSSLLS
jgi:hypothetical protein